MRRLRVALSPGARAAPDATCLERHGRPRPTPPRRPRTLPERPGGARPASPRNWAARARASYALTRVQHGRRPGLYPGSPVGNCKITKPGSEPDSSHTTPESSEPAPWPQAKKDPFLRIGYPARIPTPAPAQQPGPPVSSPSRRKATYRSSVRAIRYRNRPTGTPTSELKRSAGHTYISPIPLGRLDHAAEHNINLDARSARARGRIGAPELSGCAALGFMIEPKKAAV